MPRKTSQSHLDPTLIKLIHASLPTQSATGYISRLEHWSKMKGKEWLAARIKAIWNMALLERAGQPEQIPGVARASRIGVDASGYPRGSEGDLVRRFAKIQKPSRLRQVSVALRAYTALRLDETSEAQRSKAEDSITSPTPTTARPGEVYCLTVVEPWIGDSHSVTNRKSLRFDNLNRLSGTSRYPGLFKIPGKDLDTKPFLSCVASLLTKGIVPQPLITALGDWKLRQDAEWLQRIGGDLTQGRISVIQEGGAKARVVAMPNAWVQFYCLPYHNHIMHVIRLLESGAWINNHHQYGMSCATMQTVGVDMALAALREQRFCAAVDLSSATDRFPLGLQQRVCSLLNIYEFGEALNELKGPWRGLDGSTQSRWYYGTGQPMGLYGSFPLFHLTHFLLLNSLSASLQLEPDGRNFAVLGDDVVLFNEPLRRKYLWALDCLGVPVSQHKCYEGNLVEFAGFLITKSGNSATAFRPYKHNPEGFLTVMNTCHAVGSVVRNWSPYWAKAYDEYVKTRGLRNLSLEPLYSDPDDPHRDSGLPGSRWIGQCLNTAVHYPLSCCLPTADEADLYYDRIHQHWETERFALLKEGELLIDIGNKGVTDPSLFEPSQYKTDEENRKRRFSSLFQEFGRDPLIADLRHHQERLHEMQLSE